MFGRGRSGPALFKFITELFLSDSVDHNVKVRSGSLGRFHEYTVLNNLCVGCEIIICVNVSHVACKVLAAYSEVSGIEYLNVAVDNILFNLFKLLGSAGSRNSVVKT